MRFLILLVVATLLIGCTPFSPPAACVNQPSRILDVFDNPTGLDRGLLIVNAVALKSLDNYRVSVATAILDRVENELDSGTTYVDLVLYILEKMEVANDLTGSVLFVVGPHLEQLSSPLKISPCDRALIRLHLRKQRALLALYSAGS